MVLLVAQAGTNVLYYADYQQGIFERLIIEGDLFANRIFSGEVIARGALADNGDILGAAVVGVRKIASNEEWNAHRLKKLWRNGITRCTQICCRAPGLGSEPAAPVSTCDKLHSG